jgi:4-hydroxybenzoate polyprenyltransferase
MALGQGRAAFKASVADAVPLDPDLLPFTDEVLELLRAEHAKGRLIYLASAADHRYVDALAASLGLFEGVFASDGTTNLKGEAKARVLCAAFGRGGFDYIGNSNADLPVWADASGVLVANASPALEKQVEARFPSARIVARRNAGPSDYVRAMRPHHWLKNLLLLVPGFTAHRYGWPMLFSTMLALASFSLCASGIYVLNDLLDLRHDRKHRSKRYRPLASGKLDMMHGVVMCAACLVASLALALLLPLEFLWVLCCYGVLTLAYSLYLKRQPILDVMTLAGLYGVRIAAGAAALSVTLSPWLLAFSVFFFLCLALVKRSTELLDRIEHGSLEEVGRRKTDPSGRGYRPVDFPVLQTMASASGYMSVLVFILYANSPKVMELYGSPERLWVIPGILLYWISRVMLLTHRGMMHDDPVVFAARDKVSLVCAGLMLLVVAISI